MTEPEPSAPCTTPCTAHKKYSGRDEQERCMHARLAPARKHTAKPSRDARLFVAVCQRLQRAPCDAPAGAGTGNASGGWLPTAFSLSFVRCSHGNAATGLHSKPASQALRGVLAAAAAPPPKHQGASEQCTAAPHRSILARSSIELFCAPKQGGAASGGFGRCDGQQQLETACVAHQKHLISAVDLPQARCHAAGARSTSCRQRRRPLPLPTCAPNRRPSPMPLVCCAEGYRASGARPSHLSTTHSASSGSSPCTAMGPAAGR